MVDYFVLHAAMWSFVGMMIGVQFWTASNNFKNCGENVVENAERKPRLPLASALETSADIMRPDSFGSTAQL